jgi:uncharacterized membrane protein YeaQ/YmgE (transglycosylase-associated protein family)
MSIAAILWIVFGGLIVGAIARLLVPGRQPIGFLGTIAVGIGGAFLGWWIGRAIVGAHDVKEYAGLWAVGGAVILVLVIRAFMYRRSGLFTSRRW